MPTITESTTAAILDIDPTATVAESASRGPAHLAAWIHSDRLPWPVACIAKLERVILRPNDPRAYAAVRIPDVDRIPVYSCDGIIVGDAATDATVAAIVAAYHELLAAYGDGGFIDS